VALVTPDRNKADAVASMFIPDAHLGPIYGGVAAAENQRFHSYLVGTLAYRTGDLTKFQTAAILLFETYWLIPAFVVIFAFMVGGWLHQATERIAARRLTPKGCAQTL